MSREGNSRSVRVSSLSLFYPLHDEEENIEEAVRRALAILPAVAEEFEVILVDDGSRDRTGLIADRLAARDARVRAVHHSVNRGYGAALRSGLDACRHEWIFYTDGDNQFDLREISLLIPLRHGYDIVTGYRIESSGSVDPEVQRFDLQSRDPASLPTCRFATSIAPSSSIAPLSSRVSA